MSLRYVEVRQVSRAAELSLDLARHLQCRLLVGRIVIFAKRPSVVVAVLGKRWQSVVHDVEREYSSTLNPIRRAELARQVRLMRQDIFTSARPAYMPRARVYVTTPGSPLPPDIRTAYITEQPGAEEFVRILRALPNNGALVLYGRWSKDLQAAAEHVWDTEPVK